MSNQCRHSIVSHRQMGPKNYQYELNPGLWGGNSECMDSGDCLDSNLGVNRLNVP